ncbi:MAG: hypothetical protein HOD92_12550 [Deltaproteobacteria bacterium]|jgi:hypothetical protein|nr:hypothetical protein [Deltaproteobacteria bacterium]
MTLVTNRLKGCHQLIYLLLLLLPTTTFSEVPQEYPNIMVLGNISPLASEEGLSTPLIIWKHQSSDYPGDATLDVFLETSILTAGFSYPLDSDFQFGYQLSGTIISEGFGSDIYINGSRAEEMTFEGNNLMFKVIAKYSISHQWSVHAEVARKSLWFDQTTSSAKEFKLPDDHFVNLNGVKVIYEGEALSDKDVFMVSLTNGNRSQWHNWGLDNDAASKKAFNQLQLKWENTFDQPDFGHLETTYSAGTGKDLDLVSGYRVGGIAGQYPVLGYYRNEFRVKDVVAFRLLQEIEFEKDRKLQIIGDLVSFHRFNLDYLDSTPETQTIGGLGVGFFYGIRSLKGLPIIFTYGEGLNVHEDSKEKHRRELMVALAVAF